MKWHLSQCEKEVLDVQGRFPFCFSYLPPGARVTSWLCKSHGVLVERTHGQQGAACLRHPWRHGSQQPGDRVQKCTGKCCQTRSVYKWVLRHFNNKLFKEPAEFQHARCLFKISVIKCFKSKLSFSSCAPRSSFPTKENCACDPGASVLQSVYSSFSLGSYCKGDLLFLCSHNLGFYQSLGAERSVFSINLGPTELVNNTRDLSSSLP